MIEATKAYRDYGWRDGDVLSHQYLVPVVERMLDADKQRTILDLGCGNGALARHLYEAGYNIWGADASESGIAIANARCPGRFFVQDIGTGCLQDELAGIPFDLVISTEVIEHLYAPRIYMQFVRSILEKRKGEIILSTPYHGYLKNLSLALAGKLDEHFTALWDGGHIKFWSRRTLTMLLKEFSFEVMDFRGAGRLPWLWKSMAWWCGRDGRIDGDSVLSPHSAIRNSACSKLTIGNGDVVRRATTRGLKIKH